MGRERKFLIPEKQRRVGGLWKNDLGGPGGDLAFIGNDPKRYEKTFEAKNKAGESREALVDFIRRISQASDEDFASEVDSMVSGN